MHTLESANVVTEEGVEPDARSSRPRTIVKRWGRRPILTLIAVISVIVGLVGVPTAAQAVTYPPVMVGSTPTFTCYQSGGISVDALDISTTQYGTQRYVAISVEIMQWNGKQWSVYQMLKSNGAAIGAFYADYVGSGSPAFSPGQVTQHGYYAVLYIYAPQGGSTQQLWAIASNHSYGARAGASYCTI